MKRRYQSVKVNKLLSDEIRSVLWEDASSIFYNKISYKVNYVLFVNKNIIRVIRKSDSKVIGIQNGYLLFDNRTYINITKM